MSMSNSINKVDSAITDTTIFIDITLDNNRILRIQNPNAGPLYWGTEWGALSTDTTVFSYNRLGSSFVANEGNLSPSLEFGKGNIDNYLGIVHPNLLPANFEDSFFAPGNYAYSMKTNKDTTYNYLGSATDTVTLFANTYTRTLLTPGVNFLWVDSTGTSWETINGSGDQTGSYFTITNNQPVIVDGAIRGAIITAKFVCNLYDDKGHVMRLTNGQFRQFLFL